MDFYEYSLRFPEFKTKCVTLSFDDGNCYDRTMVEILNRYGIKCTFNVCSGIIQDDPARVQFDELNTVYKGHEVASHTFSHPLTNNLDLAGIAYQITKDRELLEAATGSLIQGFAYPFGLYEQEGMVDLIGKCGIKYARTTVSTGGFSLPKDFLRWNPTCHQENPRLYDLAEKFFVPDDMSYLPRVHAQLFFIWGHAHEYKNCWENLEKMCKTLSGKENVWYATNGEIIDYISAYRALRRSVNGKIVHNPTDVDVFVSVNGKNVLLEKGKTTVLE